MRGVGADGDRGEHAQRLSVDDDDRILRRGNDINLLRVARDDGHVIGVDTVPRSRVDHADFRQAQHVSHEELIGLLADHVRPSVEHVAGVLLICWVGATARASDERQ